MNTLSLEALQSFLDLSPKSIEIVPDTWSTPVSGPDQDSLVPNDRSSPFIFLDGNLGVTQSAILKLYMMACQLLSQLSCEHEHQRLIACTSAILIANPAHQHSLNLRKVMIQEDKMDAQKELLLLEALLICSKDCAKQSIIWNHRRWLYGVLYPARWLPSSKIKGDSDLLQGGEVTPGLPCLPLECIRSELRLLRRACEIYPRNYYAWGHFHFCMEVLLSRIIQLDEEELSHKLLFDHVSDMKSWIDLHISDHSAIHHICYLSRRFSHHAHRISQLLPQYEVLAKIVSPSGLFEHSMSLLSFYPTHEALWLYLRSAAWLEPDAVKRTQRINEAKSSSFFDGRYAAACSAYWKLCEGSQNDLTKAQ